MNLAEIGSDARLAIAGVLLFIGGALLLLGALGQLRLPDLYTRLHALAPTYSLGGALVLTALGVEAWDEKIVLRLALLGALLGVFGPPLTNLLANAAHAAGLAPRVGRMDADKQ
jgi:multicomponent Na+:H+ antiporter subunit G